MGGEGIIMKQMVQPNSPLRRAEDDEELFDSDDKSSCSSTPNLTDDEEEEEEEDAASSPKQSLPSSPVSVDTSGPLYELSSLLDQLPIKRGLSKYYEGKSQSYSSLSNVHGIEDLPKKENPYRRKLKPSNSYAGIDASHKRCYAPGPPDRCISKKISRGSSCASLITRSSSSNFLCSSKPPAIPVTKNWNFSRTKFPHHIEPFALGKQCFELDGHLEISAKYIANKY